MTERDQAPDDDRPAPGVLRFVDRFDRGEYWLAHEELEEVWLEDRRDCFKGMIHMAAALLHAERDNPVGARTKMDSALEYLRADPGCPGFDSAALLEQVASLRKALPEEDGRALGEWASQRPPLRPIFELEVAEGIAPREELPYRVRRHDRGYRPHRDSERKD